MNDRRDALAALVLAKLQTFDNGYRIETRMRQVAIKAASEAARVQIMGSPVRYCEVIHAGTQYYTDDDRRDVAGRGLELFDIFNITWWHQYGDAETYDYSSAKIWDTIISGSGSLYEHLNATYFLTVNSASVPLGMPGALALDLVDMTGDGGKIIAHKASTEIRVG